MPRRAWGAAVLIAAGWLNPVAAQPLPPARPMVPDHPPSILGAPIAAPETDRPNVAPFPPAAPESRSIPASFHDSPIPTKPVRAAGLGAPVVANGDFVPASDPVPAGAVDTRVRQAAAATRPADPVNEFLTRRAPTTDSATPRDRSRSTSNWKFGENLEGLFGERGEWFRSDHAFDGFISPVTNPFLFEDPRSLTEVRPIFLIQKMPNSQPDFQGGNITYFGVQGRVAFTDRLSFVWSKLGGIWINPGSGSPVEAESGFAEIWLGPKYTFVRNEDLGSLVAGGLQFQIPVGSRNAFQHNGTLSLVPYVSYAQSLFRDFTAGSVNTILNTGYSFSTTGARSDYWYISGHIDLDVMNCHKFYPLFEMNYYLMTSNGDTTNIGSEGRDLINFGGQASGKGLLTGAFGARYKITENAQVGGAFEFPFAGPRDLFQYRFTLDFILRY